MHGVLDALRRSAGQVGLRSRLQDVAYDGTHEEQTNAAVSVLEPLVSKLRLASADSGIDTETLGAGTWDFYGHHRGHKSYNKIRANNRL